MDEENKISEIEETKKAQSDELSYENSEFVEDEKVIISGNAKKNPFKEIYEWVSSVACAVILAFVINTFFFSLVQVDGSSMVPTLHHGERLIVRKIAYTPKNSDVIIVKSQPLQKYIVKRVVASPTQEISFDSQLNVMVDGEVIEVPYIEEKQLTKGQIYAYPVVVPKKGEVADIQVILAEYNSMPEKVKIEQKEDKLYVYGSRFVADGEFVFGETTYSQNGYFVLGDNRNNSADSRMFGIVPEEEVIGEAIFRFLPISEFGVIE